MAEIISPTEYMDILPNPDKEWLWYMYRARELEARTGIPNNSITLLQLAILKSKDNLIKEQLKLLLDSFIRYQQILQLLSEHIYNSNSYGNDDNDGNIQNEGWDVILTAALKKMSFNSFERFMDNSNLIEFLDNAENEKYLFWISKIMLTSKIDWPASIIETLIKFVEKIE